MAIEKKIPQRTCIGCREEKNKKDLIRIVKNKEGEIFLDRTSKKNGRGAYICDNHECFLKAKKKNALARAYQCPVPVEIYDMLEEEFLG